MFQSKNSKVNCNPSLNSSWKYLEMSRLLAYMQNETAFKEFYTLYHHVDNFYPPVKRKKGQSISIVVKIGNKAMYPS